MNLVELQIPAKALLEIFRSKSVATGMTQMVPGGGTLTVRGRDKHTQDALPLVPVMLALGPGDAIDLVSSWLCEKLTRADARQILIEGIDVEVTAEGIKKAVTESINFDGHVRFNDRGPGIMATAEAQIDPSKDAVVCLRVPSDFEAGQYVQGSTINKCDVCASAVLVSPSSQAVLAAGRHQIVCMECWTQANPPEMSPEQRESKLRSLRAHTAAGEQAYDNMFEKARSSGDATMFYSEAKESFYSAIGLARELDLEEVAEELDKRLAHIKAVFRSQFT